MSVEIASRELRNDTRGVLRRVEAGEQLVITVDGRPVAMLGPLSSRRRWTSSSDLLDRIEQHQADAGMRQELQELAPDTVADLPSR
ncbi:MAG: type II toxin-antitoxin system Phd/YefM family antitoxin [Mycobacteriales bacterium]